MLKLIDYIIKLIEVKQSARKLIVDECLKPLKIEIDDIHANYIKNLISYRDIIEKAQSTHDVLKNLGLGGDIELCRFARTRIFHEAKGLIELSDKKLDGYSLKVKELVLAIVLYL